MKTINTLIITLLLTIVLIHCETTSSEKNNEDELFIITALIVNERNKEPTLDDLPDITIPIFPPIEPIDIGF